MREEKEVVITNSNVKQDNKINEVKETITHTITILAICLLLNLHNASSCGTLLGESKRNSIRPLPADSENPKEYGENFVRIVTPKWVL